MRKVSIYVCMTFEDMYSERNFLYTEVFPELQEWCRERKLELEILDPGLHTTEEACQQNSQALAVSLKGIDRCRPFFLGFFGQRRGFLPQEEDIAPQTFTDYPGLADYLGQHSFVELCSIHALIDSFSGLDTSRPQCLLYYRDEDCIRQALRFQPRLKSIYTDEPKKRSFFSREVKLQSEELSRFLAELSQHFPVIRYQARWDEEAKTPELSHYEGEDLSAGSLTAFRIPAQFGLQETAGSSRIDRIVPPQSLKQHLLTQLKQAIRTEVSRRRSQELTEDTTQELYLGTLKQISEQDRQLLQALPGFSDPLYRKILLLELKQSPDSEVFVQTARERYGDDPVSALRGLCQRLLSTTKEIWLRGLLGFLAFSGQKLSWERLPHLLASYAEEETPVALPPEARRLLFSLSDFISTDETGIEAQSQELLAALQELFAGEAATLHRVLAEDCLRDCIPEGVDFLTCRFQGEDASAFLRLPRHASLAFPVLMEQLLCNPYYLIAKIRLCGIEALLSDYEYGRESSRWEEFQQLVRILRLSGEVLEQDAEQLYIQLLLKRGEHPCRLIWSMLELLKEDTEKPRLLPIQNYGEDADSPLEGRFQLSLPENAVCGYWSSYLYVKGEEELCLYDKLTGRLQKRFTLSAPAQELMPFGNWILIRGSLTEPVHAVFSSHTPAELLEEELSALHAESTSVLELEPLLPAITAAGESGPVFVYSSGNTMKLSAVLEGQTLLFLDASTQKREKELPFSSPIRLLAMDEECYVLAEQEETISKISIYEQESDRLLGRTLLKNPDQVQVQLQPEHILSCSPEELLLFDKKTGELLLRLRSDGEQAHFGSFQQALWEETSLFLAREHGYVELYDRESLQFTGRLRLHEDTIRSMGVNASFLYTLDEKGLAMVWRRQRLNRKEEKGGSEDGLLIDLFQANGSLYPFCRAYSAAMSPVNLKVRRQGVPVLHYNPEVRYRRYLVHWYYEPLCLMLLNLETLQNDYHCSLMPPEGFLAQDLKKAYWRDNRGFLLYHNEEERVAVQILNMDTDKIEKEYFWGDRRRGCELILGKEKVWLFSAQLHKDRYSYPGKCYCEVRELGEENPLFFLPMEKNVRFRDIFIDEGILVFIREVKSGHGLQAELVSCNISDWLRESPSREKRDTPIHCPRIPAGEIRLCHRQSGIALFQYENGGYAIFQYREGKLLALNMENGSRIIACNLTRTHYFLAREGGVIEFFTYESTQVQCHAYVGTEIHKMLGTGAGLITVWTSGDEMISFQMEKARKKKESE